ncbi:MAG TPA: hypothetical protein VNN73_17415 [Blastocatellia bacterium]|nr:hypothetical protein [Blastocatellia bacterium]
MPVQTRKAKITDLRFDERNANRGTERGMAMLDHSLRKFGAGRSVLADKNLKLIAGNKTVETASQDGFDEIIVVPTDGRQLVVVQRTDLDMDADPRARELAIADNRVAELNLDFDADVLEELGAEIDLDQFFFRNELEALIEGSDAPENYDFLDGMGDTGAGKSAGGASEAPKPGDRAPLAIVLSAERLRRWIEYKQKVAQRDDTKAFNLMLDAVFPKSEATGN